MSVYLVELQDQYADVHGALPAAVGDYDDRRLAFLCLLPLALRRANRAALGRLSRRDWWRRSTCRALPRTS